MWPGLIVVTAHGTGTDANDMPVGATTTRTQPVEIATRRKRVRGGIPGIMRTDE